MATIELIYGESGWLRLVPCIMDSTTKTQINSLGTKVDFTYAVKSTPTFTPPASATTAGTKYLETSIANNNKVAVVDNGKSYLLATGEEISTESSNTSSTDKIECTVTSSKTLLDSVVTAYRAGTPLFVIREVGKSPTTGTAAAYDYLFGTISEYKENPAAGPLTFDFTITAKKIGAGLDFTIKETTPGTPDVDESDFNTAATGASNTITPVNDGTARTITAITTTDWSDLKAGKIVRK